MNEVSIKFDWINSSDEIEDLIEIFTLVRDKKKIQEDKDKVKSKSKSKKYDSDDDNEPPRPTKVSFVDTIQQCMISPEIAELITSEKLSEDELKKKSMKELRALCKEKKIIGYSKLNKDNLIQKLK